MGTLDTPAAEAANALIADELALWQLRTTLALTRGLLRGGTALDDLLARHPALHDALDAAAALGLAERTLDEALDQLAGRLQAGTHTPLQRLRLALGLDVDGACVFVAAALANAEPRLAALIDELHGEAGQPTRATLTRAFGARPGAAAVQALAEAGALAESGRALAVPRALWSLAFGLPAPRGAFHHRAVGELPALEQLILPPPLRTALDATLAQDDGTPRVWLLHGGPGSGRHSLAAALARAAGLGLVEAADAAHGAALGAAAALLGAMPLARFDPPPGEAAEWPLPWPVPPWRAACLPAHGTLRVPGARGHRIELGLPERDERATHWRAARPGHEPTPELLDLRLPRALLHRVAQALPPDTADPLDAALAALADAGRHALDGIARPVPAADADEPFALTEATQAEFDALLLRCRHRDRLRGALPAGLGAGSGVRALFKGPSGTGKTLAARRLAALLRRPLVRVDLAATVSKYIGETERNLERVFSAAESLDVVLLLDEGDALLAGRTGVANATDRYANLETNYLLQRLEHYAGVLVVTTNAAERIDGAFARRMDVSIEFPLPDAATRLALWQAHLGTTHALPEALLERVALRAALAGGQIRQAALHAALLALDAGHPLAPHHLLAALEREYRKAGQHVPSFDEEA